MSRDLPEQHGFNYKQTANGQQVIQRKSIIPPGAAQGTYININVPYTNAPQGEEDDTYPPRLPTSTRKYQPGIYGQPTQIERHGNRTFVGHKGQVPPKQFHPPQQPVYTDTPTAKRAVKPKRGYTRWINHIHPLVWLSLGMIAMVFLWVGYSNALQWWQVHQDDTTYGRPRTYQIDAIVGHGDSKTNPSHFIAVNWQRHVFVIEIPGGDTSKSRIYNITTLFGDGQDLTPVTLTFTDPKGNGKPDMIIHIQDQRIPFYNDGTQFRPAK